MNVSDSKAAPKPFVFVLMPFAKDFDDTYKLGIKEVAKELDSFAERVDEQHYREDILDRIINQIAKADVIVADMTGRNPNVYYEVGYAHALNKIVVLLTKNADDIPFDLKHRPHIIYENISSLKDKLKPRLAWAIEESRRETKRSVVCPIQFYIQNLPIPEGQRDGPQIQFLDVPSQFSPLQCQIQNISGINIKDPITHVYLLLQAETLLDPVVDSYHPPPDFFHSPPIGGRFAKRYRVPLDKPISLPAWAIEPLRIPLAPFDRPLPRLYYLPAILEVLVADCAFRFRFDIVYTNPRAD